ncbi:MAG TPA: phosphoglycerate dehydrogenase [Microlunatus sp.]|nr:phosphoglycerate dehydrogenase [Microlunatus sp.]
MTDKYRVQVLNHVSARGLRRLPWERFAVSAEIDEPHAILLRSADLHARPIPESVLAVGRAGSGTNNIPVALLSQRGVPVFNAPGANANAVKELVLAGMLLAARNLDRALPYVTEQTGDDPDLEAKIEAGKKSFAGYELAGHTLGVVGLGKIGCLVADVAIKLGMHVIGYDPDITVEAAWSLPSSVKKAHSLGEILRHSNFLTVHVPLVDATRGMIDAGAVAQMKRGAVVLNFSRGGVVDDAAVLEALVEGQLSRYVCDFPASHLMGRPGVILLPHLGASTGEAEENCAVMVADQVRDYLLDGTIRHAVNFPDVELPRESPWRIAIANANVPNMVGGISHELASAGLNIATMTNKSRGDLAYTIVDVDSDVPEPVVKAIETIDGVLMVRYLPQPA